VVRLTWLLILILPTALFEQRPTPSQQYNKENDIGQNQDIAQLASAFQNHSLYPMVWHSLSHVGNSFQYLYFAFRRLPVYPGRLSNQGASFQGPEGF
jgi:hypothetical protein